MSVKIYLGGEFYAVCSYKHSALCTERQNSSTKQHHSIVKDYPTLIVGVARISMHPGVLSCLQPSPQCKSIPHNKNIRTSRVEKVA
jgi:hypothetical protein